MVRYSKPDSWCSLWYLKLASPVERSGTSLVRQPCTRHAAGSSAYAGCHGCVYSEPSTASYMERVKQRQRRPGIEAESTKAKWR